MSVPESKYLSAVWRDDIFSEHFHPLLRHLSAWRRAKEAWLIAVGRGQGRLRHRRRGNYLQHADQSLGSARRKRLHLGPKRSKDRGRSERHRDGSAGRQGYWPWRMRRAQGKMVQHLIGSEPSALTLPDLQVESLEAAAAQCVKELGGIDYVM